MRKKLFTIILNNCNFYTFISKSTYMVVQELIDKLAEIEGRKIFLQDRLRVSLDEAKKSIDLISELESDIFHMRQEIELHITNN